MSKVLVARLTARDKRLATLSASNFSNQSEIVSEIFGLKKPQEGRAFIACKDLPTTLISPLFYDQSVVFLCKHNGIAQRPSLLRWMCERDLLFPVMESGYGYIPAATLVALSSVPHGSLAAFHKFEHLSAALSGTRFATAHEVLQTIAPFDHLSRASRSCVLQAVDFVTSLPKELVPVATEILNAAITGGELQKLETAQSVIKATNRMMQAKWLEATPQLALDGPEATSDASGELDLVAGSLNINYSERTDDAQAYLRAIEPYRGSLAFLLKPGAPVDKALDQVEQINAELRRVMASRRMRVLSAVTNVFSRRAADGFEKYANAIGAPPGTTAAVAAAVAVGKALSPSRATIRNAALAAYFGSDVKSVQVWRIRDRLSRH